MCNKWFTLLYSSKVISKKNLQTKEDKAKRFCRSSPFRGEGGDKTPEFLLTMTTLSDHRQGTPQTRPALRRLQNSSGEPSHHPSYWTGAASSHYCRSPWSPFWTPLHLCVHLDPCPVPGIFREGLQRAAPCRSGRARLRRHSQTRLNHISEKAGLQHQSLGSWRHNTLTWASLCRNLQKLKKRYLSMLLMFCVKKSKRNLWFKKYSIRERKGTQG